MIVPYNGSRKTRGFTLTEVAIVMGVVGLILGGIWIAAAAVYTNHRVNTAYTQVMKISQGIRALMATSTRFDCTAAQTMCGVNITTHMKKAGVIPKDMWSPNSEAILKNPWGTNARVISTDSGAGFFIEFNKLPQDGCIQLVSKVAGPGQDAGLYTITGFGGKLATEDNTDEPVFGNLHVAIDELGVMPTALATGCSSTSNSGNFVVFGFRL